MKRINPVWCVALFALMVADARAGDAPVIERNEQAVTVQLKDGVTLRFLLDGPRLLGLHTVRVGETELKSPDTCVLPVLAQELGDKRYVVHALKLDEVKAAGEGVQLRCTLLATESEAAFRRVFLYAPDFDRALGKDITPALSALKEKNDAAEAAFAKALAENAEHKAILSAREAKSQEAEKAQDKKARQKANNELKKFDEQIRASAEKLRPALAAGSTELAAHLQNQRLFQVELNKRALEVGMIHRDYYRFPLQHLPAEFCALSNLREFSQLDAGTPVGTLTWTFQPESRVIAGWRWTGWRHNYAIELTGGRTLNCFRQMGSWEIGGKAGGLQLISLRYRGLGKIDQTLSPGPDGGVESCFTTTEIMPGAVSGTPVISPAVPSSVSVNDRGFGLRHRTGAWINKLARGGGAAFVDFQARPMAMHAAFPLRQGNLRALTEIFPGDRVLSQTDEEWFKPGTKHETTPEIHLVLNTPDGLEPHEIRTRWLEVDQHVRDAVAEEIGYVQYEVLPAIGLNFDSGFAAAVGNLAKQIDSLAAAGVKKILVHHPGWLNGRALRQGELKNAANTPEYVGGGDCVIYDWAAMAPVRDAWREVTRGCARHGIAYYVWNTGFCASGGPFAKEIGIEKEREHWAVEADGHADGNALGRGGPRSSVGGPLFLTHDIRDEKFRKVFLDRIEKARQDVGLQGFWADSFQNTWMSKFSGDPEPLVPLNRDWWEVIGAWSKQGIGFMSESQGFPTMSCSIEVAEWEKDIWCFQHVNKWLRGSSQGQYKSEELDRLCFRLMAAKGWLAPEAKNSAPDKIIPSFNRYAREYMAALPSMRRPYLLQDDVGVLWLPFDSDSKGVYFSISARPVPGTVKATGIVDGAAATTLDAQRVYRVEAENLAAAFGARRGSQPDERLGRKYTMPEYTWPDWAKEKKEAAK